MSLELFEGEIKKNQSVISGSGSGSSPHEHAGKAFFDIESTIEKENPDGSIEQITTSILDTKTDLPNPSGTTTLEYYCNYFGFFFGNEHAEPLRFVNKRFKVNQISGERKSRGEYERVATASANGQAVITSSNVAKKVMES